MHIGTPAAESWSALMSSPAFLWTPRSRSSSLPMLRVRCPSCLKLIRPFSYAGPAGGSQAASEPTLPSGDLIERWLQVLNQEAGFESPQLMKVQISTASFIVDVSR